MKITPKVLVEIENVARMIDAQSADNPKPIENALVALLKKICEESEPSVDDKRRLPFMSGTCR